MSILKIIMWVAFYAALLALALMLGTLGAGWVLRLIVPGLERGMSLVVGSILIWATIDLFAKALNYSLTYRKNLSNFVDEDEDVEEEEDIERKPEIVILPPDFAAARQRPRTRRKKH